jgi:hypothetical protein
VESIHTQLLPFDREQRDQVVTIIRAQLQAAALGVAWAEGKTMTQEQVIAYALEETCGRQ